MTTPIPSPPSVLPARPMTRSRAAGIAAAVAVILLATLPPTGDVAPVIGLFGPSAVADIVRNVLLFLPLGAALSGLGWYDRRVVLAAAALSAAVEVAQLVIPGRDPSPIDLMSNAVGAAVGVLIARSWPAWRAADGRWAPGLAAAAVAAAALAYAGPPALFVPWPSDAAFFSQWTPNLAHLGVYRGRVLAATLADRPLPPGLVWHSPTVGRLLRAQVPLRLTVVAAPPPDQLADIFSIYDHFQHEVLLVGAVGSDLIIRQRTFAAELGLDGPERRLAGALAPYARGDTFDLAITRGERGACVAVDSAVRCGVGYTAGDGWTLVWYPRSIPGWAQRLLGLLWMAAFAFPCAYYVSRVWLGPAVGVLVAAAVLVPLWTGQPPTRTEEWAAVAIGVVAARVVRRRGAG